jgi:hypothetical protein
MGLPDSSTPFTHHPNAKEDGAPGNGLLCFKDKERECGPDCMAFGEPPPQPDYLGKQWANCMELVSLHRSGKHLVVLAQAVHDLTQRQRAQAADQARFAQQPPPVPR